MNQEHYISLFEKYLDGQATKTEISTLIQWLKKEDDSFKSWIEDVWDESSVDMDPILQEEIYAKINQQISIVTKEQPRTPRHALFIKSRLVMQRMLRIAAVILLLIITGTGTHYYTKLHLLQPSDTMVSVEKGQKSSVVLPDGSKVWINADSKLTYGKNFNSRERSVYLDGEAYFEVYPNKNRPFIVHTKNLSVRALGTSFNVKSYQNDETESTVLVSGKVQVTSCTASVILHPNEKITFDKATSSLKKEEVADVNPYNGWINNTLNFDGETLGNISKVLERYYNVQIIFKSETLKQYSFTGNLGNTSLDSILQILSFSSPLLYTIEDSVILLDEDKERSVLYEKSLK